jgi:hypothetical protein
VVPSGSVIWKKPLPLIATSKSLLLCCSVPCAKLRVVAATRAPQADLQAGGQHALVGAGGAGLAQVLVHQVLEHHAPALVAVGADVGEVVRDGVQLGLLAFHPGLGDPQGSDHGGTPGLWRPIFAAT